MNIWEDDVAPVVTHTLGTVINFIEKDDSHLYEAAITDGSNGVATTIDGYIAKQMAVMEWQQQLLDILQNRWQ